MLRGSFGHSVLEKTQATARVGKSEICWHAGRGKNTGMVPSEGKDEYLAV
jgi:hypothetical protein